MTRRSVDRSNALRQRAGVIGLLECCRCLYPLVKADTSTGHDHRCPAHGMTLGFAAAHGTTFDLVARSIVEPQAAAAPREPELGVHAPTIGEVIEVQDPDGIWVRAAIHGVKGGAIRFVSEGLTVGTVSTSDEGQTWRRA